MTGFVSYEQSHDYLEASGALATPYDVQYYSK